MKSFPVLISCAAILLAATTNAFSVTPSTRPSSLASQLAVSSRSRSLLRESATADDKTSIYEAIGIEKDQLAMGINPDEVLEWIGTREDMITKAMEDIPKFDRQKAEMEVDKYLKDPEVVNYHIEFKKRLAENPDMLVGADEGEGFFSFQTIVTVYIAYVVGNILYKNYLYQYVDLSFIPGYAIRSAVDAAADAAAPIVDAVSSSM